MWFVQPQLVEDSHTPAHSTKALPPFLCMPHGPAGATQQGLQQQSSQGPAASSGVRSVNRVHGLASPPQKAISKPHASAGTHRQSRTNNLDTAVESSRCEVHLRHAQKKRDDEHMQPGPCQTQAVQLEQDAPCFLQQQQQNALNGAQQQARLNLQQPHARQQPANQQASTAEHPTASQHSQQGGVTSPDTAVHKSPRREPVHKLNGVRMVEGGWQARLGQGRTRSKQGLGIYPNGTALSLDPCSHSMMLVKAVLIGAEVWQVLCH